MENRDPRSSILDHLSSIRGCNHSHRYTRNPQPDAVNRISRRYKKRPPIRFAPVKVSRMAWDLDSSEEISLRVDDVDAGRASAVDVSLDIYFHAVGIPRFVAFSFVEKPSIAQGAIGFHVEHANMAAGSVIDIQERLIRREAQAIGIFKVVDHRCERLPIRG